jgi:peptidoglycan/xylan/chitin deacetylase (PgdA/CDA1 family)
MGNGRFFYYRAPGSSWKEKATKIINKTELGQKYVGPVLWDIGGELHLDSSGHYQQAADWACWSHKLTVNQCLEGYLNRTAKQHGGIVLMHDVNKKTAKMLDKYIKILLDKGYTFVTLDEMNLKH